MTVTVIQYGSGNIIDWVDSVTRGGNIVSFSPTLVQVQSFVDPRLSADVIGTNFQADPGGNPTGGTITGFRIYFDGNTLGAELSGFAIDVVEFVTAVERAESTGNFSYVTDILAAYAYDYQGSAGDDVAIGGNLSDFARGMGGNDIIDGGKGDDIGFGGDGDDVLIGGLGNDDGIGDAGNDTIDGGKGNDYCNGGDGNDTLRGRGGADRLWGVDGNDLALGGTGADRLFGGNDDDILKGGGGNDLLRGGAGNDKLIGNGLNDTLDGGTGNDVLSGGAGNDWLNGGRGNDILKGLGGADTFAFEAGGDRDKIKGFEDGLDRIDLTDFDFANAAAAKAFASQSGGDTIFDFGSGDVLIIFNMTLGDLSGADFIF